MPLQALFWTNDTELIALNSNDDDIFYLISVRRNHKDLRYTDLQLDLQFRHHFRVSRPTVEQLCLLLGNCPQLSSEFNYTTSRPPIQLRKEVSMIRKGQFLCIEFAKIREKMVSFGNFARIASICVGFHLGKLHGYFVWPNLNFRLEYQITLVLICRYSETLFIRCSAS